MIYSEKELRMIEEYASIYLTITDIAVILDLQADKLRDDIKNRNNPASKAYFKGKVLAKIKINKQEMELAQIGSPLALENAHRNLLDMEDDE